LLPMSIAPPDVMTCSFQRRAAISEIDRGLPQTASGNASDEAIQVKLGRLPARPV
jgi:hypothetical protein